MSYNPTGVEDFQIKSKPVELMSPQEIYALYKSQADLAQQLKTDPDKARQVANVATEGEQQNQLSAATMQDKINTSHYTTGEAGLKYDQNQAVQPEVMRGLQDPNQPPQGQSTSLQAGQAPQYLLDAQQAGQQQPAVPPQVAAQQPQDPIAQRAALQAERAKMLEDEKKRGPALALNPVLAALQKQKEGNLGERETANGTAITMKQNADWGDLKSNVLDPIMTPPKGGWNPLRGDKAIALSKAIAAIPGSLTDNPKVKEWITMQKGEPQTTIFNPAGTTGRMGSALLTDWRDARNKYETQYGQPFLQIQGIKNSKAYGTSLGDQSMIDKLIIMETGTKPTEAQYANLSQKIGFADMFDIASGKFKQGQQLSAAMRKNLESEIEEQARIGHQAYTENMAQAKEEAKLNNLNPDAVIRPGGSYGQVDAFMKRPKDEPQGTGTVWQNGYEYNATTHAPTGRKR